MRFTLTLLVLAAAGCSSALQDMGLAGGVSAYQMTANTFRIEARGNGHTVGSTIQDCILLKAAETTQRSGSAYFLFISAADATRSGSTTTPGYAQTSAVGDIAFTTYTTPTVETIFKPGQDAYIRVHTLKPKQAPPTGALLANEIIQSVGKRVKCG